MVENMMAIQLKSIYTGNSYKQTLTIKVMSEGGVNVQPGKVKILILVL